MQARSSFSLTTDEAKRTWLPTHNFFFIEISLIYDLI